MKYKNRERYQGNIPKSLLRPIRAGLLQGVDIEQLIALVATLEPIRCLYTNARESSEGVVWWSGVGTELFMRFAFGLCISELLRNFPEQHTKRPP